jgi:hypothetical protein
MDNLDWQEDILFPERKQVINKKATMWLLWGGLDTAMQRQGRDSSAVQAAVHDADDAMCDVLKTNLNFQAAVHAWTTATQTMRRAWLELDQQECTVEDAEWFLYAMDPTHYK